MDTVNRRAGAPVKVSGTGWLAENFDLDLKSVGGLP